MFLNLIIIYFTARDSTRALKGFDINSHQWGSLWITFQQPSAIMMKRSKTLQVIHELWILS